MFYSKILLVIIFFCVFSCSSGEDPVTVNQSVDPGPFTHVVLIGDTGTGETGQYSVAEAIVKKCKNSPCDFGVLLGDNFYPDGVRSTTDPQWQTKFELPYQNVDFLFNVVLGNHDVSANTTDSQFQIAYSALSDKWNMPDEYYSFTKHNALFLGLHTTPIFLNEGNSANDQGEFISSSITNSNKKWVIALGHHPYISNGDRGPIAGSIVHGSLPADPFDGRYFRTFFDEHVCNKTDLYIAGHDHTIQILPGPSHCSGIFAISGTGAYPSPDGIIHSQDSHFGKTALGFIYMKVGLNTITLEAINIDGEVDFTHVIRK